MLGLIPKILRGPHRYPLPPGDREWHVDLRLQYGRTVCRFVHRSEPEAKGWLMRTAASQQINAPRPITCHGFSARAATAAIPDTKYDRRSGQAQRVSDGNLRKGAAKPVEW